MLSNDASIEYSIFSARALIIHKMEYVLTPRIYIVYKNIEFTLRLFSIIGRSLLGKIGQKNVCKFGKYKYSFKREYGEKKEEK